MSSYYHAGTRTDDRTYWSNHTRRTQEAAAIEARKMAAKFGGRPIVESWDRSWGLRPGDCNAVASAEYVD